MHPCPCPLCPPGRPWGRPCSRERPWPGSVITSQQLPQKWGPEAPPGFRLRVEAFSLAAVFLDFVASRVPARCLGLIVSLAVLLRGPQPGVGVPPFVPAPRRSRGRKGERPPQRWCGLSNNGPEGSGLTRGGDPSPWGCTPRCSGGVQPRERLATTLTRRSQISKGGEGL